DLVADRMARGGRLVYAGAGTAGRLGVLDASECPPTFNTRPGQVVGLIAGGPDAMVTSVEGAEDSAALAEADLAALGLTADDTVVGVSASGRTPRGGLAPRTGRGRRRRSTASGWWSGRNCSPAPPASRRAPPRNSSSTCCRRSR